MPRIALVANTWPLEPTERTTIEATTTIKSTNGESKRNDECKMLSINANFGTTPIKATIKSKFLTLLPTHTHHPVAWCKILATNQCTHLVLSTSHTYDAYRLADETQSPAESHVLGTTAGRPQSDYVLDTEEYHQADFHPEECLVGEITVLIDGRQDAEYQANQHQHETAAGR